MKTIYKVIIAIPVIIMVLASSIGIASAAPPAGKGSQKNSYYAPYGPGVLADSYQIVYAAGVDQQIIDNVNDAAKTASRATRKQISSAPGTYTITIEVTDDDVCGVACAYTYFDGSVMTNTLIRIESWIPAEYSRCLAVHELGHALGLGHYEDARQIMNPVWTVGQSPCSWGRGDIEGLKAVA